MMVAEEEGVTADERPAMPASAGEVRPDRSMRKARASEAGSAETGAPDMREASAAEAWSTDMGEVCTAHAADMHATEAAGAHAAATEMATTKAAVAATPAATSGQHR